jgi:hypothetical protein
MTRLEDLKPDALIKGLVGTEAVRLISVQRMGDMACQVFYRGQDGSTGDTIVFRSSEPDLELVSGGRKWSFEGDGELFRLVSEAERIRLAYLFDPYVAVSSSTIDPLPHQISAVYEHMLPRQPMRYMLADDPGAGHRAELVSPGHPLLEACLSLVLERDGAVLAQGAMLVDERDLGTEPRMLFCLEHGLQDGRRNRHGQQQLISNRLQFLEINRQGEVAMAGSAPYLDYRPLKEGEREQIEGVLSESWLAQDWDQW